jgi:hypothetical protein
MKPRQWMQVAAVASAMGLAGTAIANDMDMSASSTSIDQSSTMSAPSADQGTMPSPSTDQNGNPLSATSDLDRSVQSTTGLSGNASSSASSDLNGNAATANEVNAAGSSSSSANDLSAPAQNDAGTSAAIGGTTQGSTMESPKPATSTGAERSSSGGHDRLANTNSDNFDAWASDYASQHNGRITRQEFLDHMGQRFDQLDTQHQGSLTPSEVEEIVIVTPASNSTNQ